jgi:hypothetical protein
MSNREKALEAALRNALLWTDDEYDVQFWREEADAALAMPATVDRASWEAGRDAADMAVAKLEYGEADDSSYDAGRLYGLGLARAAIRSLPPPEDAS